ncbi:MAG: NADH-quinone oxidoreductase subunit C [Pseudomonadota bacterium]
MSKLVIDILKTKFGAAILETHDHRGDDTAVVESARIRDVCAFLREDERCAFDMPIDVTGVDYSAYPGERDWRFEVVYHLRSTRHNHRVRLKARLGAKAPTLPSVRPVWRGVDWYEREVFDMFGVQFEGHPNLKRILTYPEFKGHPLRKDYPVRGYQPLMDMPTLHGDKIPEEQES